MQNSWFFFSRSIFLTRLIFFLDFFPDFFYRWQQISQANSCTWGNMSDLSGLSLDPDKNSTDTVSLNESFT